MKAAASAPIACVRRIGGPIAFAGLWETWIGPNGEEMETAAIITTNASRDLAALHDRMPVVVPPDAFDFWLDCRNVDATTASSAVGSRRRGHARSVPGFARGQSRGKRRARH